MRTGICADQARDDVFVGFLRGNSMIWKWSPGSVAFGLVQLAHIGLDWKPSLKTCGTGEW